METRINWNTEFGRVGDLCAQVTASGEVLITGGVYPANFSLCVPVDVAERFAAQLAYAASASSVITESEGGEL